MRKHLAKLVIFLLAGAVVNVAVAWGCAISAQPIRLSRFRMPTGDDNAWWRRHVAGTLANEPAFVAYTTAFGAQYELLEGPASDVEAQVSITKDGKGFRFISMPYTPVEEILNAEPTPWDDVLRVRAGWPLASVSAELREFQEVQISASQASVSNLDQRVVFHAAGASINLIADRFLPLRPLPIGFAVNTLFYAALLWLLIPGPFVLRRFLRVRRGLCPACGYDLRHAEHKACPECGVTA